MQRPVCQKLCAGNSAIIPATPVGDGVGNTSLDDDPPVTSVWRNEQTTRGFEGYK